MLNRAKEIAKMPAFVIVQSGFNRTGETEAILCAPNTATGVPDHKTDVPVRVRLVSEQVLSVDDDSCAIIWSVDPL